jgi:hypothetical protein
VPSRNGADCYYRLIQQPDDREIEKTSRRRYVLLSGCLLITRYPIARIDPSSLPNYFVQKGPAFKHGMESTIDADAGQVRVHSNDEKGKEKDVSEKIDLPADLANGMVSVLLKNIGANAPKTSFSLVSTTSKPRVVKLVITSRGDESFSVAGFGRKATHYAIKIEIGGIAGVIAPISGKQPPDRHMWIYGREVPTMVKFEGPLCEDGSSGQIVPTGPEWPHQPSPDKR